MSYNAFSSKYPIDIVVLWVDGSDPNWLKERSEVLNFEIPYKDKERYRDWGLMKYWFRGIEMNAPWINRIHFVTWGHLPTWLNVNHPKLNIVKHVDYMPKEALPTFNSNALLINIHRIPDLSEHFIIFNDDMLLINKVKPDDFFKNNLPRYKAIHCPYRIGTENPFFPPLNNCAIINKYFPMRKSVLKNIWKWISPSNGSALFSTLLMLPFPAFYGFIDDHLPSPYLKKTFEILWEKERNLLQLTSENKERSSTDVNEWLAKYWQIASGQFYPPTNHLGKVFFPANYSDTKTFVENVCSYIEDSSGLTICINDGNIPDYDLKDVQNSIRAALSNKFPNKSSFEI